MTGKVTRSDDYCVGFDGASNFLGMRLISNEQNAIVSNESNQVAPNSPAFKN
jgi:hypothetical protein